MAKSNTIQIKLVSSAETGFFYVTKKNVRNTTGKLETEQVRPGRAQARRLPRIRRSSKARGASAPHLLRKLEADGAASSGGLRQRVRGNPAVFAVPLAHTGQ